MSEQNLSRMGTAKVTLIRDEEGRRVIEKSPVSEVEFAFITPLRRGSVWRALLLPHCCPPTPPCAG